MAKCLVSDFEIYNTEIIADDETIRAMTREEHVYGDDVESFRPERFLDSSGKPNDNDTPLSFGFGRRFVDKILCR